MYWLWVVIWSWTIEHQELMPLNCGAREDSESPLDYTEIKPVHPKGNQPWIFIGRAVVEAEAPILWPHDGKSQLIWKDPNAGRGWRQEEKGMTEDEMVGWHQWIQWTWVWANSGREWRIGKPGILQSIGWYFRHHWVTEQQQKQLTLDVMPVGTTLFLLTAAFKSNLYINSKLLMVSQVFVSLDVGD